jgi:hypothetical protein
MFSFVYSNQIITDQLQNGLDTISLMKSIGLTTNRVQDLYYVANSTYFQLLDENKTDFSAVTLKLSELKIVSDQAFNVLDEFKLFEMELNDTKDIDLDQIMPIYDLAKKELKDERYSIALDKLTEARQKIAELKSFGAKTRAISTQLGKNILSVFSLIKYWIIGVILFLLLIYILFRKRINKHILLKNYDKCNNQKEVLQGLIKKLQSDYFMGNTLSETSYKVKLKKYDDLIYDLNRKMAILKEDMLK